MIEAASQHWIVWALVSMLCFGFQSFLYKRLSALGGDLLTAQVVMPAMVCLASLLVLVYQTRQAVYWANDLPIIVAFALLQGAFFYWTTWFRMDALDHGMPTNVLFPILKTSTIIVIVLSATVLGEWTSLQRPVRFWGIICSLAASYLLMRLPSRGGGWHLGMFSAITAVIASAGASLMAKGVMNGTEGRANVFAFILCANVVTLALATGKMLITRQRPPWRSYAIGLSGGTLSGLLSFGGIAAYMLALVDGELSVVASVSALYILIPILLASRVYRERITFNTHVAIALTILAVVLLSL